MKLLLLMFIIVFAAGCTQQAQYQGTEEPVQNIATEPVNDSGDDAEVSLPIEVIQQSKANFSAVTHRMSIENPQWNLPIKYSVSYEDGVDSYRLNATKDAIKEAIAELESLSSLKFEEFDQQSYLTILIRKSIPESEKPDKASLGIVSAIEMEKINDYTLIKAAKIEVVPMLACAAKIEVMHEILHALGFAHGTETNSLMYAYAYKNGPTCSPKVVASIKTSLRALYP